MYLDWMWYCVFLTDGVALSIFSLSLALDGADIQDRKMQPLCNDSSIPCSNSLLHVTFAISHIILITNSLLHVTFARKAQIIGHTSYLYSSNLNL